MELLAKEYSQTKTNLIEELKVPTYSIVSEIYRIVGGQCYSGLLSSHRWPPRLLVSK